MYLYIYIYVYIYRYIYIYIYGRTSPGLSASWCPKITKPAALTIRGGDFISNPGFSIPRANPHGVVAWTSTVAPGHTARVRADLSQLPNPGAPWWQNLAVRSARSG